VLKPNRIASGKRDAMAGKLLFMTAVGSKAASMDLVVKDVNHLRTHYTGDVDVFFMHYDGSNDAWLDRHGLWYAHNVRNRSLTRGIKFPLVSSVITDYRQIEDYSWVWVMDEDIDITQSDISKLFILADESESPIVGPAISSPPGIVQPIINSPYARTPQSLVEGSETSNTWCNPGDPQCLYQSADPKCRFSYTNFIEVMAPLFQPLALWEILKVNTGTFSDRSVWGLDLVWCSLAAKVYAIPRKRGCALIDKSPVIHTHGKSLPKYGPEQDKIQQQNVEQYNKVINSYAEDAVFTDGWWKPQCMQ